MSKNKWVQSLLEETWRRDVGGNNFTTLRSSGDVRAELSRDEPDAGFLPRAGFFNSMTGDITNSRKYGNATQDSERAFLSKKTGTILTQKKFVSKL